MFFEQLKCPVQHYAWGEKTVDGKMPYIAQLLGIPPEDLPWAELWIGAHTAASSMVVGETSEKPLDECIAEKPLAYLGHELHDRGVKTLPFLLKVLCCSEPLSIQSHPDGATAIGLHAMNPVEFPDSSHKPEVLWAISEFKVMAGFRPIKDALRDIGARKALRPWLDAVTDTPDHRQLCNFILHADASLISSMTQGVLGESSQVSPADALFAKLADKYPGDCGAFFAYLLNQITLKPGEGVFVRPNMPHAYLCGRGVECMANSNNVIRAGLTPKTVNKELLMETLDFTPSPKSHLLAESAIPHVRGFDFACEKDFRLRMLKATGETFLFKEDNPAVILVLDGVARISSGRRTVDITKGTAWFKAASMGKCSITPIGRNNLVAIAE